MQTAIADMSMDLLKAGLGERLRVVSLGEGKRCRRKLCSLGVRPGCELELVQCPKGRGECGCCIVACGKDRIAIGKGMAEKIMVEKVV